MENITEYQKPHTNNTPFLVGGFMFGWSPPPPFAFSPMSIFKLMHFSYKPFNDKHKENTQQNIPLICMTQDSTLNLQLIFNITALQISIYFSNLKLQKH